LGHEVVHVLRKALESNIGESREECACVEVKFESGCLGARPVMGM
jgi:hypothetical protein